MRNSKQNDEKFFCRSFTSHRLKQTTHETLLNLKKVGSSAEMSS